MFGFFSNPMPKQKPSQAELSHPHFLFFLLTSACCPCVVLTQSYLPPSLLLRVLFKLAALYFDIWCSIYFYIQLTYTQKNWRANALKERERERRKPGWNLIFWKARKQFSRNRRRVIKRSRRTKSFLSFCINKTVRVTISCCYFYSFCYIASFACTREAGWLHVQRVY